MFFKMLRALCVIAFLGMLLTTWTLNIGENVSDNEKAPFFKKYKVLRERKVNNTAALYKTNVIYLGEKETDSSNALKLRSRIR